MKILPTRLKLIYHVLRDTVRACMNGDFVSQCAALSYYTFFAIAPLFVIALAITDTGSAMPRPKKNYSAS